MVNSLQIRKKIVNSLLQDEFLDFGDRLSIHFLGF
jgi:hypothetical protein